MMDESGAAQAAASVKELLEEAATLEEEGRRDEAVELLRQALAREPANALGWHQLGCVLLEQGKAEEAEAAHRETTRLVPGSADAHNNLGAALKEQGRADAAVASFHRALELDPRHFQAQFNLGKALMDEERLGDAIAELERAHRLQSDYVPTHMLLAFAHLWQGREREAVSWFRGCAQLTQNHGRRVSGDAVSGAGIRHDAEQARYLTQRNLLDRRHAPYVAALERIEQRVSRDGDASWRIPVSAGEMAEIEPSYNRLLNHPDCPRLPGGAINPALDVVAIEARYHERRPELMHLDGLLTDEALAALRRYCLEATIWKRGYPGGYLGAFIGDGFASSLLLQAAEELRLRFPAIFKAHRLIQAWAFKYDNVSHGLKIHADTAAVNVNFWITPDDANLDLERGGLVVWDREAPAEWDFEEYNNERKEPAVMEFLEQAGARAVTIPYRQNRAVIFNSNLFHCTDSFNFEDEYPSRRVNITLLYGNRAGGPRRAADDGRV